MSSIRTSICLIIVASCLHFFAVEVCAKSGLGKIAPKPSFRDPVYDGAADPVLSWNKQEQKWFMFYTNRRANLPDAPGVSWGHGPRIGIRSIQVAELNYINGTIPCDRDQPTRVLLQPQSNDASNVDVQSPGEVELAVERVETSLPPSAVSSVGGFIGDRMRKNKENYLKSFPIDDYVGMVEAKRHRDWKWVGEHPGKWLETAVLTAELYRDQSLRERTTSILDRLIAAQEKNGYLGVTDPEIRTDEMPLRGMDAYELYFMLHGLLTAYEVLDNENALATARRLGDYFVDTIGPGKAEFWPGVKGRTIAGHNVHYCLEGTLLIDPMLRLYTLCGDDRYLKWSQWCVDNIDRWSGHNTFSSLVPVAEKKRGVFVK